MIYLYTGLRYVAMFTLRPFQSRSGNCDIEKNRSSGKVRMPSMCTAALAGKCRKDPYIGCADI
jgi:hypothetical protein